MKDRGRIGRDHVVVLGGSMAGLLAARVLTEHFDRVTLVERDVLSLQAGQRRGVPQGRHTHALLASGTRVLDRLFDGLSGELLAAGAIETNASRDIVWHFEGGDLANCDSDLDGVSASRPFIEAAVRRRVLALPNLRIREGAHVMGLVTDDERRRVTGIRLLTGECLPADLVVDATGRGSRLPEWLRTLGYEAPVDERVEVGIQYVTRRFKRHPSDLGGKLGVVVPPTPTGKRGGVMLAQEDGCWTVTLIAQFLPAAPLDVEGFRAFAAGLPSARIHAVISTAEPAGDAVHSPFPASVRRRYEKLSRLPEGLLVMGDAFCGFNPIYGQGMSVSALEATALGDVLASGAVSLWRSFFGKVAAIVDGPWATAVGNDLRMPEVTGARSPMVKLINAYVGRLHRGAHTDPALVRAFLSVSNLAAPPTALFAPAVVWRVLRQKDPAAPASTQHAAGRTPPTRHVAGAGGA